MRKMSGRVIGVFGLPCAGKTTLINAVKESSKEIIAHISTGDIARKLSTKKELDHMKDGNLFPLEDVMRSEILKLINKRKSQGAEVIFLDGCPRFDDQILWMLENQLTGTDIDGCLVKVVGDNLLSRAYNRNRDQDDEIEKKIIKQGKMIYKMEKIISRYGIPYYTIVNTDMMTATIRLAKIAGLRK